MTHILRTRPPGTFYFETVVCRCGHRLFAMPPEQPRTFTTLCFRCRLKHTFGFH